MVSWSRYTLVMALPVVFSASAYGEATVRSSRVLSSARVQIKPWQPVFASLEVVMDGFAEAGLPVETPHEVEQEVVINGQSYLFGFNSNPAALFELDRSTVERASPDAVKFTVTVMVFFNVRDGKHLFPEPGEYEIRFSGGASVSVLVEEPTTLEKRLLTEIDPVSEEYVSLIVDSAPHIEAILPRVDGWLRNYRGTSYAALFAIPVGQFKLRAIVDEYRSRNSSDLAALSKDRLAIMKEYLEPFVAGEISSPHQARAAYIMAQGLADRARHATTAQEADGLNRHAAALLNNVSASPLSGQYRRQAQEKLEKLRTRP